MTDLTFKSQVSSKVSDKSSSKTVDWQGVSCELRVLLVNGDICAGWSALTKMREFWICMRESAHGAQDVTTM